MPTVARLLSTGTLRANLFDELSGVNSNIGVTSTGTFYCDGIQEGTASNLTSNTPMRMTSDKKLLVYDFIDELSPIDQGITPTVVSLYNNIGALATYMNGYLSEYKNPSFYAYNLDGDATYINDGGGDMYDAGNYTRPWLLSGTQYTGISNSGGPSILSYANTTQTITDTDFRYASVSGYTQLGLTHPLMLIGTRNSTGNPVGFQKEGNSGADGFGTLASGFIYNGSTVNGFTVYSYIRQTYNAGDPSHCDLYILLGHSNWDSSFGVINSYADPVSSGGNGGYLYTSGAGVKNILSIVTLLSKSGGVQVTNAECQTVTDNIINRVKLYFGF